MKDFTANTHGLAWMKHVETIFQSVFDSYGFMRITLPLVESSDLFLKKLGDKIKSEIFTFKNSKNHELALRPEMTSPVIKYFLDNHQNDTLPIRLSYKGKVFRKQSSRPAPGEEFTHIGAEILGVNSLLDDVESITAAWTSIEKLNLTNCVLTLNNLGIIINLVRGLDVDEIFKNHFLENLRTHEAGSSSYQALLEEYATDNTPSEYRELSAILNKLSSDEEKLLLTKLLNMIHPHFSEDQDEADDVVQGVLAKIKRQNQHDSIHRILELCEKLQQVQGSPDKAIQEARSILSSYEISLDKLNDLEFTCQSLISYGIPEDKLRVDFGLGRDIKYYTGIIYEIHHKSPETEEYICGGGRYDDLIRTLGHGDSLSGCGFAFNMEKLCKLLMNYQSEQLPLESSRADLCILVNNDNSPELWSSLALSIRDSGFRVIVEQAKPTVDKKIEALKMARIPLAVVLTDSYDSNSILTNDIINNSQEKLSLSGLLSKLEAVKSQ